MTTSARLVLATLLVACTSGKDTGADTAPAGPPGLAADIQPIFDRNCTVNCHSGSAPSGDLDLSAGAARASLVDVPSEEVPTLSRVAPGDPDGSYLLYKIEGTDASVGGPGSRMPPELILSSSELDRFRAWVEAGAPD